VTKTVAIIADSHFDEHSRFDECVRVHRWIAEDIAKRGVDLVLHSGDVYERKSTPKERMAAADFFRACAEVAPVIIARGNHDAIGDLPLLERLETRFGIEVIEGADICARAGFRVAVMGWPTKASVLALGAESHAEGELIAGDALRNVLRGLGQQLHDRGNENDARILLAHAMLHGSVTSTGQPLIGADLEIGWQDLHLVRADLYALGHVHKHQDFGGSSVVYPGSPRRTAFGELEAKGYILATFGGSELCSVELVETPCAPMVLVDAEFSAEHSGFVADTLDSEQDLRGAEIRLRYDVKADEREGAREAAEQWRDELIAAGAVHVKLEEKVIPTSTARAPEVARATTTGDKLRALWKARGTTPDETRAERLLGMVAELEGGVSCR
jgi:DNA repair exonuclease SbcCD nuclease subunit